MTVIRFLRDLALLALVTGALLLAGLLAGPAPCSWPW